MPRARGVPSRASPARLSLAAGESRPLLPRLGAESRVLADLECPQLSLQLPVAREPFAREAAVGKSHPDRAPRLVLVRAVGEAAVGCQLADLPKGRVEHLLVRPELQLA